MGTVGCFGQNKNKKRQSLSMLMKTLSEYANGGFYLMKEKMEMIPDYFDGQQSFLTFISKYAMASAND